MESGQQYGAQQPSPREKVAPELPKSATERHNGLFTKMAVLLPRLIGHVPLVSPCFMLFLQRLNSRRFNLTMGSQGLRRRELLPTDGLVGAPKRASVDPGKINPCLFIWGCPWSGFITFGGPPPPIDKHMGLVRRGQHHYPPFMESQNFGNKVSECMCQSKRKPPQWPVHLSERGNQRSLQKHAQYPRSDQSINCWSSRLICGYGVSMCGQLRSKSTATSQKSARNA